MIVEVGDRIVFIERKNYPPGWAFPGGFVDLGETPEQCAIRETREEIGMTIAHPELMGIYAAREDPAPIIVVSYVAKPGAETPVVTAEATEVRYFHVDEIPWNDLAFDTTRQALEAWKARIHG